MARGVLDGLRVLEFAEGIAGPYTTKLLADLGADVIKVEPPEGDAARRMLPFVGGVEGPERSIPFLHLNTSKRSVRLAGDAGDVARLQALAGTVELFVTDRSPADLAALGLDPAALRNVDPALVALTITPFGESGPHQHWRADPFTSYHGAGEGYLTPVASNLMPEVVDRPPLRQGRFASEYKLATYTSMLGLAGVYHARASGIGQHIELSKQDGLIGLNFFEFQMFLCTGWIPSRASLGVIFGGIMPCRDGHLQFTFHEDHQFRALVKLMGDPDWANESWAATHESRSEHGAAVNARVTEWLSTRTREEVVSAGQDIGVTVAPYLDVAEVTASEQLGLRQYFQPVSHPVVGTHRYPTAAYRFSAAPVRPDPAPLLGADTEAVLAAVAAPARPSPALRSSTESSTAESSTAESSAALSSAGKTAVADGSGEAGAAPPGVLAGIRVLDFTWAVAGPTATMFLASLGAEVIKVETALRLDVIRRGKPHNASLSRHKKAVTLNLRHPKAVELAKRLVEKSDVVAESFRPGVLDGLGLGYDVLRGVRPDVVMLSSSMAGRHGPAARFAGYAPMFVALSGLGEMTGYGDGPPTQIRVGGDVIVGIHGGFALLAALVHRQATGQGTHIDLSAIEAQACLVGESLLEHAVNGTVPSRSGNDEPGVAPHNTYRCRGDDSWVAIVASSDAEWRALVGVLGDPALAADGRFADGASRFEHRGALDAVVGAYTATRTAQEVTAAMQAAGVPALPSFSAPDLFADPHVQARDMVTTAPGNGGDWPMVRLGGILPVTPLRARRAGPAMGEHNHEILGGLLGLSDDDLSDLTDEGVLT